MCRYVWTTFAVTYILDSEDNLRWLVLSLHHMKLRYQIQWLAPLPGEPSPGPNLGVFSTPIQICILGSSKTKTKETHSSSIKTEDFLGMELEVSLS